MTDGWIYCFSNPSMPGILKVGMTTRAVEERAKELFTTGVALPFKIEFAKRVKNPKNNEATLHRILERREGRVNSHREFFRVLPEEVRELFDLIDGEWWSETHEEEEEEATYVEGCRDMAKCFTNGQRIRHTIGIDKIWIGTYDYSKNGIICDGKFYKSLSAFAKAHYSIDRPDRSNEANGWKECECEVDGKWISTYYLPG